MINNDLRELILVIINDINSSNDGKFIVHFLEKQIFIYQKDLLVTRNHCKLEYLEYDENFLLRFYDHKTFQYSDRFIKFKQNNLRYHLETFLRMDNEISYF